MLDDSLLEFVLASLPPAPARLLEVGAGDGELAQHLRSLDHEVVAIDPASNAAHVDRVALLELLADDASFDAALAVTSLHHVEPLEESCARLAAVVRPGGRLVIDEVDFGVYDLAAASWWCEQQRAIGGKEAEPEELLRGVKSHMHPLARITAALAPWFDLQQPERVPYLYRWKLGPEFKAREQAAIDAGTVPVTGARIVGSRRA